MGAFKWIGGLLGWAAGGPIGALIGYLLGSALESNVKVQVFTDDDLRNARNQGTQRNGGGSYGNQNTGQRSSGGYTQYRRPGGYSATEQRNSFLASLMVLSSAVIRADGRTEQSEINYVRNFVRNNFGPLAEGEAAQILNELSGKDINIYSVGAQIAMNMNYSQRLQLFHYLADLANADGSVCRQEIDVLQSIAASIGLSTADRDSILAMFSAKRDSAYTILEIDPSASDDEVKKAYRRLAMKYHPDKVAQLGPDVQKAAEAKFESIQEAYDTIKKERGIN